MHPNSVAPTITAFAVLLAAAGVLALTLGAELAVPALVLAGLLAVAQRSRLGRSLAATPSRRQHRLRAAVVLGAVFPAAVSSWLIQVNRDAELGTATTLTHNLVGLASLAGALGYLGAGPATRPTTGAPGDHAA